MGLRRRAGFLAPLFSVYSRESIGIGDFADLKLLIDWAHQTGNSIVQLLPMNELGSLFCPYDSLSSFALEPMYVSLRDIPYSKKDHDIEAEIKQLERVFLCPRDRVDYRIKKEKIRLLWAIYLRWNHSDSAAFKKFKDENAYWLEPFALYKVLKDYHRDSAWEEWEEKYLYRQAPALENFRIEHEKEMNFQMWVQWQLALQFKEVKAYAKSKKVLLKGDLPMHVSRDSADVWQHPEFFKLEFAAGAPPDMYCAKGQRWGMPTYNWERIAVDDNRYLKEKLKFAQNFYDILRIDHVVGLFRIWSIPYHEPMENKGLNGFFDPQDEKLWGEHGRKILSTMLANTGMLLCAEDLGVIPKVCTDTLRELGIPGNDVQRWVKDWKIRHDFLAPREYRSLSVAMLSTHDTTNWPAWWENEAGTVDEGLFMRKCQERGIDFLRVKDQLFDPILSCHNRLRWQNNIDSVDKLVWILGKRREEVGDFIEIYENTYREKEKLWEHLGLAGQMREKSDSKILRRALRITLESSAAFCINTIIDWLYLADVFKGDPYQYRINTPGTITENNWSLTIPLSLEELLKHKINKEIRSTISSSSRI